MSSPYSIDILEEQRTQFVIDENKCVACQACVLVCMLENNTEPDIQWRGIYSFNQSLVADFPFFHLSLACNHCEEAPCMHNCPALAYNRDYLTGAVLHNADKCIGCQYCTWACPYDAPKFNKNTKIVEKCNFCVERLHNHLKPACVTACPTGALDIIQSSESLSYSPKTGFDDFNISPSIRVIPLSSQRTQPIESLEPIEFIEIQNIETSPKISFKKEWPLTIFTFMAPLLVGSWVGILKYSEFFNKWIFGTLILLSTLFSTMHLGRKDRAFRAILNIRHSWLSREILFWSLFSFLSIIYLFFWAQLYFGLIILILGFLCLYAIDSVYNLTSSKSKLIFHSSSVPLGGLIYFGYASGFYVLAYIVLIIKAGLFIYRYFELNYINSKSKSVLGGLRFLFILAGFAIQWQEIIPFMLLLLVAAGEFIDRIFFYDDIYVMNPKIMLLNSEQHYKASSNK